MNKSVSIGLCTDTHFWLGGEHDQSEHGGLQLQGASDVLLATLVDELAAAELDIVLHLGDLTCGGGGYAMPVDAFQATLDWIHASFARLDTPVHVIPGNHDALPGAGGWSYVSQLWGLEPGLGLTIDLPAARLVLLNTHGHTPAQIAEAEECDPIWGWVSEQELARLDDALGTAGERPVLLFSHQLLQPWTGGDRWADLFGVQNGEAVLAILARHATVSAIFQGHAHRLDVQALALGGRPCTFVVLPALIQFPLAWVRLDLSPATVRMRLQPLPLLELRDLSRVSGSGQEWRAGRPEWRDHMIPLT